MADRTVTVLDGSRVPERVTTFTQDPNAKLDYIVDWSGQLGDEDAISEVLWTVPEGLTQDAELASNDGSTATIWLSGGTDGSGYSVACRITTTGGRIDERTFRVHVRSR